MKRPQRSDKGWIKHPYPYLWVVLGRDSANEDFQVWHTASTRKHARDLRDGALVYCGKGNAYVQQYGPYR